MASQGGAFGRRLSYESEALMNGVRALTKETPESFLFSFAMCGYKEKTATWNPEEGPYQTWQCWSWTSTLHNCKEKSYVVY